MKNNFVIPFCETASSITMQDYRVLDSRIIVIEIDNVENWHVEIFVENKDGRVYTIKSVKCCDYATACEISRIMLIFLKSTTDYINFEPILELPECKLNFVKPYVLPEKAIDVYTEKGRENKSETDLLKQIQIENEKYLAKQKKKYFTMPEPPDIDNLLDAEHYEKIRMTDDSFEFKHDISKYIYNPIDIDFKPINSSFPICHEYIKEKRINADKKLDEMLKTLEDPQKETEKCKTPTKIQKIISKFKNLKM